MSKELLWSDDMDFVYGWEKDFENEKEFIDTVKSQYDDGEIAVVDIKKEHCIITKDGIRADTVIPMRLSDIEIELFYTASVEQIEES